MLLTIDIGNTNIKSALFDGDNIAGYKIHSNQADFLNYINKLSFDEVAVSSVNKSFEEDIVGTISKNSVPVFKAGIQNKFSFIIDYETPETLGIDRLCSASGAFSIALKNQLLSSNQYLVTIDFGTATTINIVSPDKKFLGGLISPGIKTMLKVLNEKTAQLPLVNQDSYKGIIGKSTNSSILSGVITATIGMIKETINYLEKNSGVQPIIFATGGNARYILPYLDPKIIFDEALVLKGLQKVYELNTPIDVS